MNSYELILSEFESNKFHDNVFDCLSEISKIVIQLIKLEVKKK